jgi:hypothetical protein
MAGELGIKKNNLFSMRNHIENLLSPKAINILSLSYFGASFEQVKEGKIEVEKEYYIIENTEDDNAILLSDGSIIFPKEKREGSQDSINQLALDYAKKLTSKKFAISDKNKEMFELFIEQVISDTVEVILVLTPYHPLAYNGIKEKTNVLEEVEQYLKKYADEKNITLLGSYNPATLNLTERDMLDQYHVREHVVSDLLGGEL